MAKRTCSIDSCGQPILARGWCSKHYQRWYKTHHDSISHAARICSVDNCPNPHKARGLCNKHYAIWCKGGDPATETIYERAARLRALVADAVATRDRTAECWTGSDFAAFRPDGYPMIGAQQVGHLVLILDGRPRPGAPADRMLHSCDVPACWAPHHLRWGTQQQNVADRDARGRQMRGEKSGNAKLTEAGVREIRARYVRGDGHLLAAEYGVSGGTILSIVNHKTWRHVEYRIE